jgi:prevent-host-death family protein
LRVDSWFFFFGGAFPGRLSERQCAELDEEQEEGARPDPHTAEALRNVSAAGRTIVITQHGEAKAVLQDITSFEQTQESLALLKILAQSSASVQKGRSKPVKQAFADVLRRVKERG